MEEHLKPSPKPGKRTFGKLQSKIKFKIKYKNLVYLSEKVFSFLSQDEVEKMKQEEGNTNYIK